MNNIQKIRKEKGISQAELAKLAGISEISIRKYENGERNPKIETLNKIAHALNVSINDLRSDSDIKLSNLFYGVQAWMEFECNRMSEDQAYASELLDNFKKLNKLGKTEAIKRVAELTEIKVYTEPENKSDSELTEIKKYTEKEKKKIQAVYKPKE